MNKFLTIILSLIFVSYGTIDTLERYVDTDIASAGDGTSWAQAYKTMTGWEVGQRQDLTATGGHVMRVHFKGVAADTAPTIINSAWTTSAACYLILQVDSANRHSGYVSTSKYRKLTTRSGTTLITLGAGFIRFRGIQFVVSGSNSTCIQESGISTNYFEFSNCIFSNYSSISAVEFTTNGTNYTLYNNVFTNTNSTPTSNGIWANDGAGTTVNIYNNTFNNYLIGVKRSYGTVTLKNNIFNRCAADATGTVVDTYNATTNDNTKGLSSSGTGNRFSQNFTFADSANDNFTLSATDAGARDYGVSDPGSGLFSNDIRGAARPYNSVWDIGAFEYYNPCTPPTIAYSTPPACTAYVPFSQSATLAGGTCDSVTTDGLPEGLSLNKTTGAVTGTPLSDSVKTAYKIIAWGCANDTTWDTLTVVYGPISITSVSPDTIVSGDSITVHTHNTGIYPDSISGTMGGSALTIVSCSNDSVRIKTPTGCTVGFYTLTLSDGNSTATKANAFYVEEIAMCSLTVATTTGGTVDPSGVVIDTCGDTLDITATADGGGYAFASWSCVGAEVVNAFEATTKAYLTSGSGSVTANFTCTPATIAYTPTTYVCTVGVALIPLLPVITGDYTAVTVSPALPAGISMSSVTGAVTGTPTTRSVAASRTFSFSGNCNPGSDAISFSVIDTARSSNGNFFFFFNRSHRRR
jgi:hypothetical protein